MTIFGYVASHKDPLVNASISVLHKLIQVRSCQFAFLSHFFNILM